MPFKPATSPEDYPARPQTHNGDWVAEHQAWNLRQAIGEDLWRFLEENRRGGAMDTGEGRFEHFDSLEELEDLRKKHPKSKGVFTVGEELQIKGSFFRVKDISPFGIKLKLLKR